MVYMTSKQIHAAIKSNVNDYHEGTIDALLAIPGVTRIRRHGPDILRVLVDPLDDKPGQLTLGARQQRDHLELFDIAAAVLQALGDGRPPNISVHFEPGEPPNGYELREDEDCDGENPDAAGVGGCLPTSYWPVYFWVHPADDDCGSRRREKAQAIDDAWDDVVATIGEMNAERY